MKKSTIKNLMETQIPNNFAMGLDQEKGLELGSNHTSKIADILFNATSEVLSLAKSVEQPTVFKFEELGDFIAAGIVTYFENEDKDQPGNWSYVWTFDEKDIPENAKIISISDATVYQSFVGYAGNKYKMGFESNGTMIHVMNYLLKTIKKYLIENAVVSEEIGVTLENTFQARSVRESNGEVFCSIEIIGETKQIIKSDATIEK